MKVLSGLDKNFNNATIKPRTSKGDWKYRNWACRRAFLDRMVRKVLTDELKTEQNLKNLKERSASMWWLTIPG